MPQYMHRDAWVSEVFPSQRGHCKVGFRLGRRRPALRSRGSFFVPDGGFLFASPLKLEFNASAFVKPLKKSFAP